MIPRQSLFVIATCLAANVASTSAQTPKPANRSTPPAATATNNPVDERRITALGLLTALGDEAKTFRDEALRARVQARVADALWDVDKERARALFRRAWDAAEVVDKASASTDEDERRQLGVFRSNRGANFVPIQRMRQEVLRLAARRDPKLGEELLAKLTEAQKQQETSTSAGESSAPPRDAADSPRMNASNVSDAASAERLRLAQQFLENGDVDRALQFAEPALNRVTASVMTFLSGLREKNPAVADARYARLLQTAATDPASDPNTVSTLTAYAWTPYLYVTIWPGGIPSSMQRGTAAPPNLSPQLRAAYFRVASQILMRPLPPADQDRTTGRRAATYFMIARLLPLFEQHAPSYLSELRAQLSALSPDAPERFRTGGDRSLTRGIVPENTSDAARDEIQEAIETAEKAPIGERDRMYAMAAVRAAMKPDARARDLVEKINDEDTRNRLRAFVDFQFLSQAIRKDDAEEASRLLRSGNLTPQQRAWALTQVARILKKTDRERAISLLDDAVAAANRLSNSEADRAAALVSVARQLYEIDSVRAWEMLSDVVKSANQAPEFTGEDARISNNLEGAVSIVMLVTGSSDSNLTGMFDSLGRDNLFRAVELARNFTGEAPRSLAIIAVANSALTKKAQPMEQRRQATSTTTTTARS
ncbi:MAG: hypothetical protein H0V88_12830 [Pyrinomonadaceae bacterium]|nr:hypothetical protein [Pyrinomonadaceae bacterium]